MPQIAGTGLAELETVNESVEHCPAVAAVESGWANVKDIKSSLLNVIEKIL